MALSAHGGKPLSTDLLEAVSDLRRRIDAFERFGDPGPLHADIATAKAAEIVAVARGDAVAVRDLDTELCRRLGAAELPSLPGTAWVFSQLGELAKARY
ncbi:hypothetical protein RB614_42055 [Phytohabitans sp. ZYX-F-186]|uniref:Ketopantoate reductase C-terminal domain-containing protein n=1 Tax=Phytohabitans maris TaxID=3071409 RepID=A0ABU0ZVY8_9ACTN|nr:hypothetical protein [Phytohabitans sp. ZYX-F-186]MDQ7911093.1 hypothetical protein [Phytohabitans sp. ZYX-F-186]